MGAVDSARAHTVSGGEGVAQPVGARTGDAGKSKTEDPGEEGSENERGQRTLRHADEAGGTRIALDDDASGAPQQARETKAAALGFL